MRGRAAQGILAVVAAAAAGLAGVVAGCTGVASGAGTARAEPPPSSLTWHAPVRADGTGLGNVVAVSCPAPSFCAAFDAQGYQATWHGSGWTAPVKIVNLSSFYRPAVSTATCATPAFCVAVGQGIWVESGGTVTASQLEPEYPFDAVSCASPAFCVALGELGEVVMFNGHSWRTAGTVDNGNQLSSVSCASAVYCVALGSDSSVVIWNGTGWATAAAHMPNETISGISCASARFCMASDAYGKVYKFNGSSWSGPVKSSLRDTPLGGVSCTSPAFCVAAAGDDVAKYNGTEWSLWSRSVISSGISSLACSPGAARSRDCAAVGASGYANTLKSGRWTGQVSVDATDELDSIACPAAGFCVAAGVLGDVVAYTGGRWHAPARLLPGGSFGSVSCPSARFCLAAGAAASGALRMWRYDGTRWTRAPAPAGWTPAPPPTGQQGRTVGTVSCVSAAFCVWASPVGAISVYNGKTWTKPASVDKVRQWLTVSCATATFCVAGDADGDVATYDGTIWSGLRRIDIPVYLLSCPARRFCAALGPTGTVTFDGTTWTRSPAPKSGQLPALTALSCTPGDSCAVVGFSDSSGGRAAYSFIGGQWSRPVQVFAFDLPSDLAQALSCATPKFCVATNMVGLAAVGTGK